MSIQDLATILTDSYGMDAKSSLTFVKTVFEIVEEFIAKDKLVKIKGFGTFKLINVSDRESVNVNTGERIVIAGHSKLTFTPDAALKDAVNRPFADFETTPLNEGTSIEDMERFPVSSTITNEQVPAEETQYFDETSDDSSLNAQEEPVGNTDESSLQAEGTGIDEDDTMASSVDAVDGSSEETAVVEEESLQHERKVLLLLSFRMTNLYPKVILCPKTIPLTRCHRKVFPSPLHHQVAERQGSSTSC